MRPSNATPHAKTASFAYSQASNANDDQRFYWSSACGAPRRNRTGDPILTMNLALTAVRTPVSAGGWRP
jgi:hypothetical protein